MRAKDRSAVSRLQPHYVVQWDTAHFFGGTVPFFGGDVPFLAPTFVSDGAPQPLYISVGTPFIHCIDGTPLNHCIYPLEHHSTIVLLEHHSTIVSSKHHSAIAAVLFQYNQ